MLELASRNLRRTPSNSSVLERQEYARRDRELIWYLFRGSIWESWTRYGVECNSRTDDADCRVRRPKLESLAETSEQWPVLNVLGALLRNWMPLVDEYYHCEYNHPRPFPVPYLGSQTRLRSLGSRPCKPHLLIMLGSES